MDVRTFPAPDAGTETRLTGQIAGADAPAILAALRDAATRFQLPIEAEGENGGAALRLSFGDGGRLRAASQPGGLALEIDAADARGLYRLQQVTLMILDRAGAEAGSEAGSEARPALRPVWSRQWADQRPPNLIEARLDHIRQISPRFRRVRLVSDDFARWGSEALHFRFLLPPLGRAPVWPRIDEGGRTVWPSGEDAIHRPVYTFRALDIAAGWADVDVFVHEGGRVTRWTEQAAPGAPVGLMGPAGRALPADAAWIALLADETGLPAVARHLAALPPAARGEVVLLVDPADRQDLPAPPGLRLTWLDRAKGESLSGALADLALPDDGHIWFAGEKAEAERARALLHETRGIDRKRTHVTAYWHRSPS